MENEEFSLSKQLEMLEATALHFVDKIIPHIHRVPNRVEVWETLGPEDRDRAEELRHKIRRVTHELALAMEQSAVRTKTDMDDLRRVAKRMCAAVRFEKYTGSLVNRGSPLRGFEAHRILESGFDALEEWIDFSAPSSGDSWRNPCAM